MNLKYLFTLGVLFTLEAWAFGNKTISEEDKSRLYQAIRDENTKVIQDILASTPKETVYGDLNDGFGHYLLGYATYQKKSDQHANSDHSFVCYPNSVKALIEAGAIPSEARTKFIVTLVQGHLSGAVISYCPGSIENLANKLPKEELVQAGLKFKILDQFANDEKIAPRIIETVKTLKAIFEPLCKTKDAGGCLAFAHLKKEFGDFAAREEAERFASTPQGQIQTLRDQSCDLQIQIEQNQASIDHEKKIGKSVGIVNAKTLYDSANNIEKLKKELLTINQELAKKNEKPVPRKECLVKKEE